ncbi:flagellar assembly protein FliW [Neorhodopirellula pilleata]|uniref:Flagellar assembly factor FliW n=1 Tax=Neorhodopirellula pilleata TaxID=2714738 RepID=A0A5C6A1F2_9BACT|nr:flagellar assembly protein FliW [Neorhodopirellula pilleata]TWT93081.1 Flagellar assembly factor FliW [Neorhodopirellula pilleata]
MRIDTHRFGTLELNADQLFLFPQGLVGMETLHQWALIPDPDNESVAWLQSAVRGDRALAVISPRAFFPDYRVHIGRRDLASLHLTSGSEVYIMTTVAGHVGKLTTNLRAPLLVNLDRRLGCQVITNDDRPLRQPLPTKVHSLEEPMPISQTRAA